MTDSVDYRLGQLDARMTNVERDLGTIATDQKGQNSKLDALLERTAAVQEFKRHSWKAVGATIVGIGAIIEGAHQLVDFLHGKH